MQEKQTAYVKEDGETCVAIVGHAYNPFDMVYDENEICLQLITAQEKGDNSYFDKISELTGLHIVFLIKNDNVYVCQDACGLTGCYFGKIEGNIYVAEHSQLIADLCDLPFNKMVERLVKSKCYNIGNRHLPGNITPYDGIKRLGGNTYLHYCNNQFAITRFYPMMAHPEYKAEEEKE